MSRPHPETISPTAHYTGYVWYAHGDSHEAFATPTGRLLYRAIQPADRAARTLGLPTLEGLLVARHRLIDHRLHEAIARGEVSQIVEVAAGLSPRGWRFRTRYGDRLTYVEADLPDMIARKRAVLARLGGETATHRTAVVDALADDGPTSLAALCATLDPARGTALVTEGLVNYFDRATVVAMWGRFARALRPFPAGRYLSDLVLRDPRRSPFERAFTWLLAAFVRGGVHLHFDGDDATIAALTNASFATAEVLDPRAHLAALGDVEHAGAGRVRVLEARTAP